jgi:hypothetical protein
MDDDDLGDAYNTAALPIAQQGPSAEGRPRRGNLAGDSAPDRLANNKERAENAKIVSDLDIMEQMVSGYNSPAAFGAPSRESVDEAPNEHYRMRLLHEQARVVMDGAPERSEYRTPLSNDDSDDGRIEFHEVSAGVKYSSFKLPNNASGRGGSSDASKHNAEAPFPEPLPRPSSRGSINNRLVGASSKAAVAGIDEVLATAGEIGGGGGSSGGGLSSGKGKMTRPISATNKQKLARRAPGGVLRKQ